MDAGDFFAPFFIIYLKAIKVNYSKINNVTTRDETELGKKDETVCVEGKAKRRRDKHTEEKRDPKRRCTIAHVLTAYIHTLSSLQRI